jgi:hypothetical protein
MAAGDDDPRVPRGGQQGREQLRVGGVVEHGQAAGPPVSSQCRTARPAAAASTAGKPSAATVSACPASSRVSVSALIQVTSRQCWAIRLRA